VGHTHRGHPPYRDHPPHRGHTGCEEPLLPPTEIDGKSYSSLPDDRPYQTELLHLPEIYGKSTPLSRMAWFLCRVYQSE